uniref:Sulfotransferase n=1 Tax=Malurus cyaneus samueli TaxID=2593467 RepID=A0A8C5UDK4_9PASS
MEKPRKKFTDLVDKAIAAANSMHRDELLFSYKGIPYPTTVCSPEVFKALESFEARSDDVILAGYPKSGTNWILTECPFIRIGDVEKYEVGTEYCIGNNYQISSSNLLKIQMYTFMFWLDNFTTSYILLLIRNPKDVATSFYHFSNGLATLPSYETWDDFFTDFMTKKMVWGCYFEYLSEWNKYADKENIMTITYEELKENRALGVKNIAAFFGIPLTEEELQLVVDRSSFQSMKKNSDKTCLLASLKNEKMTNLKSKKRLEKDLSTYSEKKQNTVL